MQTSRLQKILVFFFDNFFDIITILFAGWLVIKYTWLQSPTANDLPLLATAILGILILLAGSGLWDRNRRLNRIEKVADETHNLVSRQLSGRVHADDFFNTNRQLTDKSFASANVIYLSGITLTRTTREYMHVLGQRLVAGAKIRIIITDYTIDCVLQELAQRDGDLTAKQYLTRLQAVEDVLDIIVKTPGNKGVLEVGYLPSVAAFGLVIIDPDQPNGFCSVELYHHRTTEPNATFDLTASEDPFWYRFFRQQYDILWNTCRVKELLDKA